MRTGSLYWG